MFVPDFFPGILGIPGVSFGILGIPQACSLNSWNSYKGARCSFPRVLGEKCRWPCVALHFPVPFHEAQSKSPWDGSPELFSCDANSIQVKGSHDSRALQQEPTNPRTFHEPTPRVTKICTGADPAGMRVLSSAYLKVRNSFVGPAACTVLHSLPSFTICFSAKGWWKKSIADLRSCANTILGHGGRGVPCFERDRICITKRQLDTQRRPGKSWHPTSELQPRTGLHKVQPRLSGTGVEVTTANLRTKAAWQKACRIASTNMCTRWPRSTSLSPGHCFLWRNFYGQ